MIMNDDFSKDFTQQKGKLGISASGFYPTATTAAGFILAAENVLNKNPLLMAGELTYVVMNNENVDDCDDNDDGVFDPICPKVGNVWDALQVLQE